MSGAPMTSAKHLVIMAAGTGGHIMPGLAVAEEMKRRGWSVSWLGTVGGMENRLVPPTGIPLDAIDFNGIRGKGLKHTLMGVLRLFKSFAQCYKLLGQRQANAVLGMGGYVCFPGGLMAAARRLPLVLVNADAAMLMSNKALLPVTDVLACGFEGVAAQSTSLARVTGNPVRAEIEAIAAPSDRFQGRSGPLRVLMVGGSLGAVALNKVMPQALALIEPDQRPFVTHQTGMANFDEVKSDYAAQGLDTLRGVEVVPFINNMAQRLAECDVLVCRAGAITVSELCAAGVASILVPLVVSTTSHQRDNAAYMAGHQAAVHLPQNEMSAQSLAALLKSLSRGQLQNMAVKARELAKPRAAAAVADEIEKLVNTRLNKAVA